MRASEFITESLNQPYKMKWEKSEFGDMDALVKLPDGTPLSIMFNKHTDFTHDIGEEKWHVEFYRNNSQDVTGEGDQQRIFATVLEAIRKFVKKVKPTSISFSAAKNEIPGTRVNSRANLYNKLVQRYASTIGYQVRSEDIGDLVFFTLVRNNQGVTESVNDYLWHGSRHKNDVLLPRKANDTGGAEGSNKNAIYATPSAKVAIAMGLTTPGSDTGMFPNDPQMVLFKGGIRKGENVYLHKVPKDLFINHNGREWYSKPEVKEIKPIEIKAVPVNNWLNLIRQATPQDLELQKKYTKQDVTEAPRGLAPTKPYDDVLANMGYFMSLNTVKIQQDAVDETARQELELMQQNFRKPILNGMNFFDAVKMSKNPKVAPILLKYVYDMLGYIEPRIKKYIKPDQQQKYLDRLDQIKSDYRGAIAQVS